MTTITSEIEVATITSEIEVATKVDTESENMMNPLKSSLKDLVEETQINVMMTIEIFKVRKKKSSVFLNN